MMELVSHQKPSCDFRDVSLIPTVEDLFSKEVCVRPNLVHGAFASVNHYLDIQFHLLREDFFAPMREGIEEYMKNRESPKSKFGSIRIYRDVIFCGLRVSGDRFGIAVNFDPHKVLRDVNWRQTKRFMHGSLLCFTKNNFRNNLLKDKDEYIMAESEVYFEPYYQVLKALKELNEHEFPMKRYIVEAQRKRLQPLYLIGAATFDNLQYSIMPDLKIDIIREVWPSHQVMGLDESQYKAFKLALTSDLAVIQGPPGTGKTFIGLKIAEALIHNCKFWNQNNQPMLVVCYTNHALDQFLEGILNYTQYVVRVGRQSKSEEIKHYGIMTWRREYAKRATNCMIDEDVLHFYNQIEKLKKRNKKIQSRQTFIFTTMKQIQHDMDIIQGNEGIVCLSSLVSHQVVDVGHHQCFEYNGKICESDFFEWLVPMSPLEVSSVDNTPVAIQSNSPKEKIEVDKKNDDLINDFESSEFEDDEIFLEYDFIISDYGKLKYSKTLEVFNSQKSLLMEKMNAVRLGEPEQYYKQMPELEKEYRQIVLTMSFLEKYLNDKRLPEQEHVDRVRAAVDIWKLNYGDRWILYRSWLNELREILLKAFRNEEKEFRYYTNQYAETRQLIDLEIMRKCLVVGMTTTGAARLQPLLKLLKPKIVIVEEAAEVLESHIVASLTTHCEHLILIGNCFSADSFSYVNVQEAEYLMALGRYLVLQGYEPQKITILCTYTAQMLYIKKEKQKFSQLKGVNITVVDSFQGEENDIILLSLVRNNTENAIGFLGTDNRVCVALSRAKKGLYIMGNSQILAKGSGTWMQILDILRERNAIGRALEVRCQVHSEMKMEVLMSEDFGKFLDAGCNLKCDTVLPCGHYCQAVCHKADRKHEKQKCLQICERALCAFGHICKKRCFEECGPCQETVMHQLPCGHLRLKLCHAEIEDNNCLVTVIKLLPGCGHPVEMPCCTDPYNYRCPYSCDAELQCGHLCQLACHVQQDPEHLFKILLSRCKFPCVHPCPPCIKKCMLRCKHKKCDKRCGEPCTPCREPCEWKCEHYRCTKMCCEPCDRPPCLEPCKKLIEKCQHPCIGFCGEPCPQLCRICDKEVVGRVHQEDARFVYLEDCQHTVEVQYLEIWLKKSYASNGDLLIRRPTCPDCNTVISRNAHFSNLIIEQHAAICDAKKKLLDNVERMESNIIANIYFLKSLFKPTPGPFTAFSRELFLESSKYFAPYVWQLIESHECRKPESTRDVFNIMDMENLCVQVEIIKQVVKKTQLVIECSSQHQWIMRNQIDFIFMVLSNRSRRQLSNAEVHDLNLEIQRFYRIVDMCIQQSQVEYQFLTMRQQDIYARTVLKPLKCLKYTFSTDKEIADSQAQLNEILKISNWHEKVSRKNIFLSVGMRSGYWMKCTRGHCYYSTEICICPISHGMCNVCIAEGGILPRHLETYGLARTTLVSCAAIDGVNVNR
ncbi:hypothetical protein C0J52_20558 [Blattella germanica]|nr:hypothetical protein C0J52_20558 [Blattella germanica]